MLATAAQLVCLVAALASCVFGVHRALALWGRRAPARRPPTSDADAPTVLVQLPLYNEPEVAERAVRAACALDWPRARLTVQVLDDSDDGVTSSRVDAAAAQIAGVRIDIVRRQNRAGFKAGALAVGLERCDAELAAVFDADFVPPADFLRRAVAHFDDDVDMVQCRWGHINADESWLTRAQATLLDAHFSVEQAGRAGAGRFFGFNGTAGIWRTRAIRTAGGWDARTLTEDLDLAVRAHLMGARFVYLDDVSAPAELPGDVRALRRQQERWTQGALECARARLPTVWRSRLSIGAKLDLSLKLLQNLSWVALCALVVALPGATLLGPPPPGWFAWFSAVFVAGTTPVVASLVIGARSRVPWRRMHVDVALALALASALALSNARAALRGLVSKGHAPFLRTPKRGARGGQGELLRGSAWAPVEIALGALHLAASWVTPAPMLWLCGAGLCALGAADLWSARSRSS